MTSENILKTLKIIKIVLLVIYIPFLLIYLLLFVPEYFACINLNHDGDVGTSIWGNEVPCFGESKGLGDGLFIFFSEIIAGLTLMMIFAFVLLYYLKKRNSA